MDRLEEAVDPRNTCETEVRALLEYQDDFGYYERVAASDEIAGMARYARALADDEFADRLFTLARALVSGRHLGRPTRKNTG